MRARGLLRLGLLGPALLLGRGAAERAPLPAVGAIADIESVDLQSLLNSKVVTASGGSEEQRALTAANVHSISREEIAQHGWRSLAELLGNVAGLFVIDDLVTPALGVRGVTGGVSAGTRVVKVMIDGQAVNFRPELSAFLGPEFIPMEAVERVEVAKGPLSALYGANAFIATVNVVTRARARALGAEVALRGALVAQPPGSIRAGAVGGSAVLTHGGPHHDLLVAFSIDHSDRSGLGLAPTFPAQDPASPLFARVSSGDLARPMSALLRLSLTHEAVGTFTLSAGLQHLDSGGEFQVNSVLTGRTRVALFNLWSQLRYERRWSQLALTATTGYAQGEPTRDHRRFLTATSASSFTPSYGYQSVDGRAALSYTPLGERLLLRLGLDFEYDHEHLLYFTQTFHQAQGARQPGDTLDLIAPSDARTQEYRSFGAFLHAGVSPWPRLHLTGNLRIDRIVFGPADFPVEYSWRAALAYRFGASWTARLIAGRAFQTPSAVMLFAHAGFGSANNIVGNRTVSGLPALGPQHVTSIEAIASGQIFGRASLELAVYYQDLRDKIEFTRQGLDFVATNGDARQSLGLEATLRLTYRWLSAYANTSIDGALTDAGGGARPTALYPRGQGVIGADLHLPRARLHANTQVRVVGPRGASQSNVYLNNDQPYDLPAYALWDLTLSSVGLRLLGEGSETRLLASGRNLLGEQAPEPGFGGIDLPRLGRTLFFEVRQVF